MSPSGPSRKCGDVRVVSEMRTITDINQSTVDRGFPEFQAGRPARRHRIRRSQYTKRRCQGWFGSFFGSDRGRADDGRVRHGAARARLPRGIIDFPDELLGVLLV